MNFIVATGIECSAPVIAGGERRDQLLLTDHWRRYEEDFDLVAALGISHLRFGVPFHIVARDPERFDWAWTDLTLNAMRVRNIEPIADLLHFGVPDDLQGIGDPRVPSRFLAYVAAFVDRYPWVRWYTPVNEPFITADFSAKRGWWNEQQRSDRAFVRALDNAVTCAVEGMRLIRQSRSDAMFLQSDACEAFTPADAAAERLAAFRTERGFLAFDLTYGREVGPAVRRWLIRSGMTVERLRWFETNGSSENCIVGLDYYESNEHIVAADGTEGPAARQGFGPIAAAFHRRFALPVMLAETNNSTEVAVEWLTEVWNDTVGLIDAGVPVTGFCWYSLTDQVDWDTCLREPNNRVNSFGLVDLERQPRPVADVYRYLARDAAQGVVMALPDAREAVA